MKTNKLLKMAVFLVFVIALVILVKRNVTATKEDGNVIDSSVIALEINSDTVQNVYSKLIFLEDDFIKDDTFRNFYFKITDEKKIISNEEKLYTVFNSLYKKNLMTIKDNEDGTYNASVDEETVREEFVNLFIDETIDLSSVNYSNTLDCGIRNQSYEDGIYEFTIKECEEIFEVNKNKLVSAEKDGNFINLKVKSFIGYKEKTKKGKYTDNYLIKNFGDDTTLDKVTIEEINEYTDKIFEEYDIDEYIFSFKLKGDNYYLTSVQKA